MKRCGSTSRRALALILASALAGPALAQIPRTPNGHPDFQGVWDSQWMAMLERPDEAPSVRLTDAQASDVFAAIRKRDAARVESQLGTSGEEGLGKALVRVDGAYHASIVVDPPDGRLRRTPAALALQNAPMRLDGPEGLSRRTRCLEGSGVAPLMLSAFDMMREFVQTPDRLVIHSEDLADLRLIRFDDIHAPAAIRSAAGDSIARWSGDELVIETTNFSAASMVRMSAGGNFIIVGTDATLTERLVYGAPDELVYRYTLADPEHYETPWTGAFNLVRIDKPMRDFGCHEGNYGLPNILKGARAAERLATAKPAAKARR